MGVRLATLCSCGARYISRQESPDEYTDTRSHALSPQAASIPPHPSITHFLSRGGEVQLMVYGPPPRLAHQDGRSVPQYDSGASRLTQLHTKSASCGLRLPGLCKAPIMPSVHLLLARCLVRPPNHVYNTIATPCACSVLHASSMYRLPQRLFVALVPLFRLQACWRS